MKTWINTIVFALAAFMLSVTMASALEDEVKTACEPDIAAYCAQVTNDDDALRQCLSENKDVVSAQCRQALDESTES